MSLSKPQSNVKNDRVKVAVLATAVGYGGAEKVVLSLLESNNEDIFELVPIIFARSDQIDNNIFFQKLNKIKKNYHLIFVNRHRIKYFNPILNIFETFNLLKKDKYYLIHSHGYRANFLGILLSKLTSLPCIATCHGHINNDINLKVYNLIDRLLLRFADRIIAVSDGIKRDLIKSGIRESKIEVISNAVQTKIANTTLIQNRLKKRQILGIKEREFVVGYVGRLSVEKGIIYLLEAISMLNSGMPIKTLIIGDGPQKKELEELVKEKGIGEKIIFTGFQSDTENWLPAMDVFVLPSLTEGTPMALLEAMACGIPVIASAVGGIPDVVEPEKSGVLVPPCNPNNIRDAIIRLYKNKIFTNSISREAQKTIKTRYNIKDWAKKIEIEYLKMFKKKHGDKNVFF